MFLFAFFYWQFDDECEGTKDRTEDRSITYRLDEGLSCFRSMYTPVPYLLRSYPDLMQRFLQDQQSLR